jgi:hypothetical protein
MERHIDKGSYRGHFCRTLDIAARERPYERPYLSFLEALTFLEAPPLRSTRDFTLRMISRDYPQFVAMYPKTHAEPRPLPAPAGGYEFRARRLRAGLE